MIRIESPLLAAQINPLGAELSSLRDAGGRELMNPADPAYWTAKAPLLFPIVGGLRDDRYWLGERSYEMARHGLARRLTFDLVAQSAERVLLRLTDSEATRLAYPFAFTFEAEYAIEGTALTMTLSATNSGDTDLPVSLGYHPAFAWPLPYGQAREAHRILFDADEPDDLATLEDGLIGGARPSSVEGRLLQLEDALFEADALVWLNARSRGCLYGAPEGPQLRIDWSEMPALGIWTKPGAPFVCIEPWDGHADPAGFYGEIWDKPGIHRLAPGERLSRWMRVDVQG